MSVPGMPEQLSVYSDLAPGALLSQGFYENEHVLAMLMQATAEVTARAIAERLRSHAEA